MPVRGQPRNTIATWYEEKRSGKTLARPELDRLRHDARAGAFRKLYVFRLDRLTRSGIRDTFELLEALSSYGVELVSIASSATQTSRGVLTPAIWMPWPWWLTHHEGEGIGPSRP